MQYTVLDQIGDYVVYARLGGECGPFFVRMAGDEMPLSTHWTKADARKAARRYMAADKRRQRQKSLARLAADEASERRGLARRSGDMS